ncbi:MAG: ferritin family protein [Candidatus Sulfobium sp.]|jgi:rubrerythrin
MEKYSITEVVEQAVQTEKLGFDFYTAMAGKFSEDEGLKELFDTLAAKEKSHEKRFSDLKESVKDAGVADWEEVSRYLRAIVESEFFLGRNKSLPSLDHVKTVPDAVKFALGFEKETLLYFYAVRDMIREKGVVEQIIDEEKSHITWLDKFRQGLAG